MPTQTVEPIATASHDAWTLHAGASKAIACQLPDDDGTTMIKCDTNGHKQTFTKDVLVPPAEKITSVTTHFRHNGSAGNLKGRFTFYENPNYWTGADRGIGAAWGENNEVAALHPSGVDWSPDNFASAEMGVEGRLPAGAWYSVTTINAVVVFSPAKGSWACMLVSILGSILGTGLLLSQMPDLIDTFNRAAQGKLVIHGHEAVEMYADLKANPHRRHFL